MQSLTNSLLASLITRSTNDIQQIQLLIVMILRMVLYAPIMAIGGIWKVFHTNVSMSWIIGLAVADHCSHRRIFILCGYAEVQD